MPWKSVTVPLWISDRAHEIYTLNTLTIFVAFFKQMFLISVNQIQYNKASSSLDLINDVCNNVGMII